RRRGDVVVVDGRRLHLDRRDAVARHVHDVVDSAEEPEVPVLVDTGPVAGEVDAVVLRPVRLAVAGVVAEDAAQHRGPRALQREIAPPPGPTSLPCSSNTTGWTPGNGF